MVVARVISIFSLLAVTAWAQQNVEPPQQRPAPKPSTPAEGTPWLGLHVAKPDDAIRAQLPSLPAGIGFVVRAIDPGGAAERSGMQPFDVLWKLEDQWLVNEGQFATLLRLRKPGDTIAFSIFRKGQPVEVKATLDAQLPNPALIVEPALDAAISPTEACLLTRVINRETRTASLQVNEGRASLKRLDAQQGYELEIRDSSDGVIISGTFPVNGDWTAVPEPWRRRVGALKRGLDGALDGHLVPARTPRPRVVPPAPQP